jgi:hypothetical protein
MSVTEPGRTRTEGTDVRGRTSDTFRHREMRETKPSFLTTEFWAMVAGIVALAVIYVVADNPTYDLFDACLLATIAGVGYFISRGLAKSGSHDDYMVGDSRTRNY